MAVFSFTFLSFATLHCFRTLAEVPGAHSVWVWWKCYFSSRALWNSFLEQSSRALWNSFPPQFAFTASLLRSASRPKGGGSYRGENKETGWKSSEIREVSDKKGFVLKNKEDTGNTSLAYLIVDDVRPHVALYFFDLNVCVGVRRKWDIAATIAVEDDAQLLCNKSCVSQLLRQCAFTWCHKIQWLVLVYRYS